MIGRSLLELHREYRSPPRPCLWETQALGMLVDFGVRCTPYRHRRRRSGGQQKNCGSQLTVVDRGVMVAVGVFPEYHSVCGGYCACLLV